MIVFAHEYVTELLSRKEFVAFDRWAVRELPAQVSAWRVRDPEATLWVIVVVDESDGGALRYPWVGDPHDDLTPEQANAYVRRRVEWMLSCELAGQRGLQSERVTYGDAIAPRLRSDGVWEIPAPQG